MPVPASCKEHNITEIRLTGIVVCACGFMYGNMSHYENHIREVEAREIDAGMPRGPAPHHDIPIPSEITLQMDLDIAVGELKRARLAIDRAIKLVEEHAVEPR